MDWSELLHGLIAVGPIGIWIAAGLAVFRLLLVRSDDQARENMNELRDQLREWKLRAMRAELVVRAYHVAGIKVPRRELTRELETHSELGDLGLFGTLIDERDKEDVKPAVDGEPTG